MDGQILVAPCSRGIRSGCDAGPETNAGRLERSWSSLQLLHQSDARAEWNNVSVKRVLD